MERRIFGAPRPIWHHDPDMVDAPNLFRGSDVEHAVASSLNLLTYEFPGLSVFHSASLEEDGHGEIDSIVTYRNLVFLVEAKCVAPGVKMIFNGAGVMKRISPSNNRLYPYLKNRLDEKVKVFEESFPNLDVSGLYVFSGSSAVVRSTHGKQSVVPFVEMIPFLRSQLKPSPARSTPVSEEQKQETRELAGLLRRSQERDTMNKYARRVLAANPALALVPTEVQALPSKSLLEKLKATYRIWSSR